MQETHSASWSPWRHLRRRFPAVQIFEIELPGDYLGCVDLDRGIIWLDSRLTCAERRCTLAHEIGHLERGLPCDHGVSNATDATERAIDEWAARLLIPAHSLAQALRWATTLEDAADELWVDVPTLRARLRGLTDAEQDEVMEAMVKARVA